MVLQLQNQVTECAMLTLQQETTSKKKDSENTSHTEQDILEDHEFGDVSSVNTDIIKVGQCFSVEPGIYLPDENIGVRIEDLVLITEDGCEVLNDYTKELIVVPEE